MPARLPRLVPVRLLDVLPTLLKELGLTVLDGMQRGSPPGVARGIAWAPRAGRLKTPRRPADPGTRMGKCRIIASLLAGAALGLSAGTASAQGATRPAVTAWRTFVSQAGRFRVELPVDPVEQTEERATWMGSVTGSSYTARFRDLLLVVEVRDLPGIAQAVVPADTILEATRRGVEDDVDGVEVVGHEVAVQGFVGRDFVYRLPGEPPVFERALAVLAGRRLYVVTGRADGPPGSSPGLERFFDSFRVWNDVDVVPQTTPVAYPRPASATSEPPAVPAAREPSG